jgi:hypothetical protein
MKNARLISLFAAGILLAIAACDKSAPVQSADATEPANGNARLSNDSVGNTMRVTIGSKTFSATLYDNPAVTKLKAMLPLTLNMSELNGNEKYFHLPSHLPSDAANPGTIQNGDLMLWGTNSLVLFYKSFQTSYSYTRLGRIDDPSGLAAAVGPESVIVTFELE